MKVEWRRLWSIFLLPGLLTGLVGVLTACPRRTAANPCSNRPDRMLFERAMTAADSGKFAVANSSLQTLINTCPNSKYAQQAKIALQELRRAQPNISLAWIANEMPIKHAAERQHYVEAFRRAGLD